MAKKKKRSAKRKTNTRRKLVATRGGAHVGKALEKERAVVKRLRARLAAKTKRAKNPRRPPHAWWQSCLSSVEAQRYARDPAAVCGASWWKLPAKRRAAIVRRYEHGSPRERRRAVALAKAERNRSGRPKHNPRVMSRAESRARVAELRRQGYRVKLVRIGSETVVLRSRVPRDGTRRRNPRELVSLVYLEQKPGDCEPFEYEHEFEGDRPRLQMRGRSLQIRGGTYTTRGGWIEG